MSVETRLIATGDAEALAELYVVNRAFLEPWEPVRPEAFFTAAGQHSSIAQMLTGHSGGQIMPHVIVADDEIIGRATLSNILPGNFRSCSLGYWVSESHNGRGHATAAAAALCAIAFAELGLHRVEAGTLVANTGSQTVLQRNGFIRFGLAPEYLKIAGRWQDHILFQKLNPD
jgi:ribosomal-protein-alanine N-acetyltransferase